MSKYSIKRINWRSNHISRSDDISLSTRLEKQVFQMIDKNVDIIFCGIYRLNDTFLHYDSDNNLLEIVNKEKNNDNWFFKVKLGIVTSLIKKELFEKYGYYREDYRHSSDLELIERIFCYKNNINPFRINHIILLLVIIILKIFVIILMSFYIYVIK